MSALEITLMKTFDNLFSISIIVKSNARYFFMVE